MQRLNPVRKFRRPVFAIAKAVDSRSEQVNRTTVIFSNSSPLAALSGALPAMTNPSARATRGCCHPNRLRDAATCSTAASLCLGLTALHRNS